MGSKAAENHTIDILWQQEMHMSVSLSISVFESQSWAKVPAANSRESSPSPMCWLSRAPRRDPAFFGFG
eukprot:5828341-Amphidinium_carterae.1